MLEPRTLHAGPVHVGAIAAEESIRPGVADQQVVAQPAVEIIATGAAGELVIAPKAVKIVPGDRPREDVGALGSHERQGQRDFRLHDRGTEIGLLQGRAGGRIQEDDAESFDIFDQPVLESLDYQLHLALAGGEGQGTRGHRLIAEILRRGGVRTDTLDPPAQAQAAGKIAGAGHRHVDADVFIGLGARFEDDRRGEGEFQRRASEPRGEPGLLLARSGRFDGRGARGAGRGRIGPQRDVPFSSSLVGENRHFQAAIGSLASATVPSRAEVPARPSAFPPLSSLPASKLISVSPPRQSSKSISFLNPPMQYAVLNGLAAGSPDAKLVDHRVGRGDRRGGAPR
jgi:hypothetical protein